jgi:hypothetical protein
MYQTVSRLYTKTKNTTVVRNAVKKGWITKADYKTITGEVYEEGGN